jgi:hypothetical protein
MSAFLNFESLPGATATAATGSAAAIAFATAAATTKAVTAAAAITTLTASTTTAATTKATATWAPAATTAAAKAFFARASFVDLQSAALERLAIGVVDRVQSFFIIGHFDKRKPPRLTCFAILNDRNGRDRSVSRKSLPDIIFTCRKRQIPNIDVHTKILFPRAGALKSIIPSSRLWSFRPAFGGVVLAQI